MPVTKDQAEIIAALAIHCRPTKAPRWDKPGIVTAIGRVKHLHLADVAHAALRAAEDETARTPAVITNTRSPHWRDRNIERPIEREVFDPATNCGDCGLSEFKCRANPNSGHDFVSVVAIKQATVPPPESLPELKALMPSATDQEES